jgi:hypothetical protein
MRTKKKLVQIEHYIIISSVTMYINAIEATEHFKVTLQITC